MSILDLNVHLLTFFTIDDITQEVPQNLRAEWIKASILKQNPPISYKPSMHDIFIKSTTEEINKMIMFIHPQEMKDFYLEIAASIGFVHSSHKENGEIKEQYYPLLYEAFKSIHQLDTCIRSKCLKNAKRIINQMVLVAPDLFTRRDIAFTHNMADIAFSLGFDSLNYYTDEDVITALDMYIQNKQEYLDKVYDINKKEISRRLNMEYDDLEYKTDVTGTYYYEYNIEDLILISHPTLNGRIFTRKELEFLQKDGRDLRNRQYINKVWLNIWQARNVVPIVDMIEDLFKYNEQEEKQNNNQNQNRVTDMFNDIFMYAFGTGNNMEQNNGNIRWTLFSNDIFRL